MADPKQVDVKQAEAINERVQDVVDDETARGYRGVATDPTDNAAYTIQGVTSGAPTPETDAKAKAAAGRALRGEV